MKHLPVIFAYSVMVFCLINHVFATAAPPDSVKEYLKSGTILEDGALSYTGKAYNSFIDYLRQDWRDVLDNINVIAPTDAQKKLIMVGCESLNDSEYLAFLQRVGDLFAGDQIDRKTVEQVLSPSMAREGFIATNGTDPAVRSFMEKLRAKLPNADPQQNFISDVLSGEEKKQVDEYNGTISSPVHMEASPPAGQSPQPIPNIAAASKSVTPSLTTPDAMATAHIAQATPPAQAVLEWIFVSVGVIVLVIGWLVWKTRN